MNNSSYSVKLQVTNGLKLVYPHRKQPEEKLILKIASTVVSFPNGIFKNGYGRISIDVSKKRPRLIVDSPDYLKGWTTHLPNKQTYRSVSPSLVLNRFLRIALKTDLKKVVEYRLVGPHFENGVVIYDIKK